jgi:AraC family transcriptional regulator, regulatory protein of adaptative response / methylated-DNA-[protein]-cysteine methyltransferase
MNTKHGNTGGSVKRRGPMAEVLRYAFGRTSIAAIVVALSKTGVAAIAIAEDLDEAALLGTLKARFPEADLRHDPTATQKAIAAVIDFVERPRANIGLPLDVRGTDFQRDVWGAVMKVPFGATTTFAEIAREVGAPRAVRAVGRACSQNPLEFAIPCHRVLRSDGSFAGGSPWGDSRQSTIVRRETESTRDDASARAR